ncbi:uncharacterized protein [Physcomitrium patens]|uniref:Uncharacterized protein n=1 Tax=Physcomitrium patens TaxID=3218 RepID=A0A2K1KH31_PHYPA|nr:uncharacterized protein LOC112283106 isoform X1 [Physcomitrium patens]PNR53073.1 hypothetical protein PHYPA_009448 [Physcomitrium patens]|eukprot:XP_024377201.1 uncharacterized protein LOC112283106 isoform X1 [Physcomitrella patens]
MLCSKYCFARALCSSVGLEPPLGKAWEVKLGWKIERAERVKATAAIGNGQAGGDFLERERSVAVSSRVGARERRLQKVHEERRRRKSEEEGKYPEWATVLENAAKEDEELREILGDTIGNPEEMKRRVEERVGRKGRRISDARTGSTIPMAVSFRDFDSMDSHIWLEFYAPPTDKDMDLIGSVFRSWFVLGRLGGFNSMNMQIIKVPLNAPLRYSTEKAQEALSAFFHDISDVEFQESWARVWIDLGTSDPCCLDVLINALTTVSSDFVGIKQLVFGGKHLGDWDEDLKSNEDGYRAYKI